MFESRPVVGARVQAERFVAAALAAAVGTFVWFRWFAGPFASEDSIGFAFAISASAACALGIFFPRAEFHVGGGMILPALLAAPWTAPRGDGDGLWVLIFPYLVALGGILAGVAAFGASASRRSARARLLRDHVWGSLLRMRPHAFGYATVWLVAIVACVGVLWPRPYARLDRVASDLVAGSDIDLRGVAGDGDGGCGDACSPFLERGLAIDMPHGIACAHAREVIGARLRGVTSEGPCRFRGSVPLEAGFSVGVLVDDVEGQDLGTFTELRMSLTLSGPEFG